MPDQWYFLDPDNRKDPPSNGPYCCRCMKPLTVSGSLATGISWTSVTIHSVHPWVKLDPLGRHLLGSDCWEKVKKDAINS